MAKSVPALVEPAMLRWARESIDLAPVAASRKLDLPDDRVAAWEAGEARPTIAQLRKAAQLYRRSLGVFFLPEPPQGFDTLRDLRRHEGAAAGPWSPALHGDYRRAQVQREHMLDLAEIDDTKPPLTWRIESLPDGDDGIATAARTRLGELAPLPLPTGSATVYDHVKLICDRANDPMRRKGPIYHTQGSGKTLAMVFAAARLLRDPELQNPIVLVADRVQLVSQMWDHLAGSSVVTQLLRLISFRTGIMRCGIVLPKKGNARMKSSRVAALGLVLVLSTIGLASGPAAAEPTPTPTDSTDAWLDSVGPEFVENQRRLSEYAGWLLDNNEFREAGYLASVFDNRNLTVRLLWAGDSPLQGKAEAEAKRRGLGFDLERRPHTYAEIRRAAERITSQEDNLLALGFRVAAISGLRKDSADIILEGRSLTDAVDLEQIQQVVTEIAGIPITVQDGIDPPVTTAVTRDKDTSPYNAGGLMREIRDNAPDSACTSGFAVRIDTVGYTTTARHCRSGASGYPHYRQYEAWNLASSKYGNTKAWSNVGQARVLTGGGWGRMFDGTWWQADGWSKTVEALRDVGLDDVVCVSGANSGVHCRIDIIDMFYWFTDGYGYTDTILARQTQGGQIAVAGADSGGPVLIPRPNDKLGAVGMIQGAQYGTEVTCTSTRLQTSCYSTVIFTSMRTITNDLGATLMTQ